MTKKDIIVLGVESSCDETSVAVVKNGREVLSNIIDTQIKIHEQYGGVVPEIASRNHIEAISRVAKQALKDANVEFKDIDVIAPTYGPGLVGALLVGLSCKRISIFTKQTTCWSESLGRTYCSKLHNSQRFKTTIFMYAYIRWKHTNSVCKRLL